MSLVVPLNPDGIDYIVDVPGIDGEIVTKWFKWVHEKKKRSRNRLTSASLVRSVVCNLAISF